MADINAMDKRFCVQFVNSLPGFKSANLIGTADKNGRTNLAVFSSVIHVGSNPPLFGFITRPVSVPRHTYLNLKETGYFTINHIHAGIYQQAHQTSARYPEDVSEFAATGLTEEYSEGIPAPYVKESRIKLGLTFVEEHPIEANGTIMVVGKVVEVRFDENILGEDGLLHLEKAGTVAIGGLDVYHNVDKIARLSYAKPDRDIRIVD